MSGLQHPQKSLLKVVILGDAGVGKTSLVKQYVNGIFDPQYKPTIGADFLTKDVTLPDGRHLKLQIWDTAGQERFRSIAVSFYRGADACVLVYDICDIKTFKNLEMWMKEFLENVGTDISKEDFPFVVLGNKADKSEEVSVTKTRAEAWCRSKENVTLFETSALLKQNINEAFDKIVKASSTRLLASGRRLPSVSMVDVQDLDTNVEDTQVLEDNKAPEKKPTQNKESGNPSEVQEQKYEVKEEEQRTSNPVESDESSKRESEGHKKDRKMQGRRSSFQGSQGSSKGSDTDNQGSQANSNHQNINNSARNKRRKSNPRSVSSRDREDVQSRNGTMDNIRLDDYDSSGSDSPRGCCGI